MKLIYRKIDRLIVGSVTPPQPEAVELLNITRSELGGVASDYGITANVPPKRSDQLYQVDVGGVVVLIPNGVDVARQAAHTSAQTKLRALGLTNAELSALGLN